MKIILASAELLNPMNVTQGSIALYNIETYARLSHRSEEKQTAWSYKTFLPAVILQHGDWSVAEHSSATVLFTVNRGVTHEMVRHRLFAFTQESTRFVNYARHGASYIMSSGVKQEHYNEWARDLTHIDEIYRKWLAVGYAPQIARDFLPNALAAKIAVTGNFRNWRHAFLMRTSKETHPDFKDVMIPLLEVFKTRIPILFDDIEPNARQIDNLKKAR